MLFVHVPQPRGHHFRALPGTARVSVVRDDAERGCAPRITVEYEPPAMSELAPLFLDMMRDDLHARCELLARKATSETPEFVVTFTKEHPHPLLLRRALREKFCREVVDELVRHRTALVVSAVSHRPRRVLDELVPRYKEHGVVIVEVHERDDCPAHPIRFLASSLFSLR